MKLKHSVFLAVLFLVILTGCQVNNNQNENQTGEIPSINDQQADNRGKKMDEEQYQNLTETDNGNEEVLGYIFDFDKDSKSFEFEAVEWITKDDSTRISELGLNPDNDMPGGFYIHSLDSARQNYVVSDKAEYQIIDWEQNGEPTETDAEGFQNHIDGIFEHKLLCWIVIENGSVIKLTERYVP